MRSPTSHSQLASVQKTIKSKIRGMGKSSKIDMVAHEMLKGRIKRKNEFRRLYF